MYPLCGCPFPFGDITLVHVVGVDLASIAHARELSRVSVINEV